MSFQDREEPLELFQKWYDQMLAAGAFGSHPTMYTVAKLAFYGGHLTDPEPPRVDPGNPLGDLPRRERVSPGTIPARPAVPTPMKRLERVREALLPDETMQFRALPDADPGQEASHQQPYGN